MIIDVDNTYIICRTEAQTSNLVSDWRLVIYCLRYCLYEKTLLSENSYFETPFESIHALMNAIERRYLGIICNIKRDASIRNGLAVRQDRAGRDSREEFFELRSREQRKKMGLGNDNNTRSSAAAAAVAAAAARTKTEAPQQ